MNNLNKQLLIADVLEGLNTLYVAGVLNHYEMAGKILRALDEADIAEMEKGLCLNCREALRVTGSAFCSDCRPSFAHAFVDGHSQSAEYRTSH